MTRFVIENAPVVIVPIAVIVAIIWRLPMFRMLDEVLWQIERAAKAILRWHRKPSGWDPSDPWADTSPIAEVAAHELDLTPTELLPARVLRPAEMIPDAEALRADVAHYIDSHLDPILAEPRANLDRAYRTLWATVPTANYPIVSATR